VKYLKVLKKKILLAYPFSQETPEVGCASWNSFPPRRYRGFSKEWTLMVAVIKRPPSTGLFVS
jgi:hypothetical protein